MAETLNLGACGCCGGGGVETDCSSDPLPVTLYGTITDKTGYATNLPDNVTFTYNEGDGYWQGPTGTNCGFGPNDFALICVSSVLILTSGAFNITPFSEAPASFDESPLEAVYEVSGTFGCGSMSYTLTVTE